MKNHDNIYSNNYEFLMNEQKRVGVQFITSDFDKRIHALNAFFTCYVDFEHSSKYMNLSKLMKENEQSVILAASYFGVSADNEVIIPGIQNKNLYRLVEFITVNNLWPTITKRKRGFKIWESKIETNKRFSEVINALDDLKDPELTECLRSYPVVLFAIAYTAVGLKGHEYLMSLQAATVGRIAYRDIHNSIKKNNSGFLKKLFRYGAYVGTSCILYLILSSGVLMDIL